MQRCFNYKRKRRGSRDNRTPKSQAPPLTPQPRLLDFLFKPRLPVWSPWGEAGSSLTAEKNNRHVISGSREVRKSELPQGCTPDTVKPGVRQALWQTRLCSQPPLLQEDRLGSLKKEEFWNQTDFCASCLAESNLKQTDPKSVHLKEKKPTLRPSVLSRAFSVAWQCQITHLSYPLAFCILFS